MLTLHLGDDCRVRKEAPRTCPRPLCMVALVFRARQPGVDSSQPGGPLCPKLTGICSPHRWPLDGLGVMEEVGVLREGVGEVWVRVDATSHPAVLHAVGQHDQGLALLFPNQAPKVTHRLGQRALGGNELLGAPETLVEGNKASHDHLRPFSGSVHALPAPSHTYRDEAGVDVVRAWLLSDGLQDHAGPVVWEKRPAFRCREGRDRSHAEGQTDPGSSGRSGGLQLWEDCAGDRSPRLPGYKGWTGDGVLTKSCLGTKPAAA